MNEIEAFCKNKYASWKSNAVFRYCIDFCFLNRTALRDLKSYTVEFQEPFLKTNSAFIIYDEGYSNFTVILDEVSIYDSFALGKAYKVKVY